MKPSYKRPGMVVYGREEIMEMLGPVKAQYVDPACLSCSGVRVMPNAILQAKEEPLFVSVETSACSAFQQVRISIPGSSPFVFYELRRVDGALFGNEWSVVLGDFQFMGERGLYEVEVVLIDGKGVQSAPCRATLAIE